MGQHESAPPPPSQVPLTGQTGELTLTNSQGVWLVRWQLDSNALSNAEAMSPEFNLAGQPFQISIREEKSNNKTHSELHLASVAKQSVPALELKYSVAILDSSNQKIGSCFKSVTQSADNEVPIHYTTPFREIKGQFTIKYQIQTVNNSTTARQSLAAEEEFTSDLSKIYKKGIFTDVVVKTRDKEFPAHKLLLAARSSTFLSMFNQKAHVPKEAVEIKDLDSDVVAEMLEFIYTGDCPNLAQMTGKLLEAAEKYRLARLKARCVGSLIENLNAGNALEALILSEKCCSAELKDGALEVIMEKSQEVKKSLLWREIFSSHPQLGREIGEALGRRIEGHK